MKVVRMVIAVMFALFMTASLGMAAKKHDVFKAYLSGKHEVPATMTKATGEAVFRLSKDGKEMTYDLRVKGIENVTASHIHAGKTGENGGPVVGLFGGPKKEGKFGGELAKGVITEKDLVGPLAGKTVGDLAKMIADGDAYVNVHTDKFPDGELRGQIK
ncbi:MAG: CHRD domain-containing protein [Nitrospiraceae bacterium]|nr:CHRD domain-containing protein [Nitrospiraceae bacterium]